jgi:hypothetical protein
MCRISCVILLGIALFACNKDGGNGDNAPVPDIELKVVPDAANSVAFWIKAEKLSVDWGDGSAPEVFPDGAIEQEISHGYATREQRTVRVTAEGLTGFVQWHTGIDADGNWIDTEGRWRGIREAKFGACPG